MTEYIEQSGIRNLTYVIGHDIDGVFGRIPLTNQPIDFIAMGGILGSSANNYVAIQAMIDLARTTKRPIKFPPGIVRVVIPIGIYLSVGGVTFIGSGKEATSFQIVASVVDQQSLRADYDNTYFLDMEWSIVGPNSTSGNTVGIAWGANNLVFKNCIINGNSIDGVRYSHFVIFDTASGHDGLYVIDCEMKGISFGFLKQSDNANAHNRIRFIGNYCHDNFSSDLGINSPKGGLNDVIVQDNNCVSNLRNDYRFAIDMAGGTDIRIINNKISGDYQQAIHIEESCDRVAIIGNSGSVSGGAIFVTDNNASGTRITPKNILIKDNNFKFTGTSGSEEHGIQLVYDGSGAPPISNSIISGNMMSNFDYGYEMDLSAGNVEVFDNIAEDCLVGYYIIAGNQNVRNNTSRRCTTSGILARLSVITNHLFDNCGASLSFNDGSVIGLINPRFSITVAEPNGEGTAVPLLPLDSSDKLQATSVHAILTYNSNPVMIYEHNWIWDGTTLTDTAIIPDFYAGPYSIGIGVVDDSLNAYIYDFSGGTSVPMSADITVNGIYVHAS